MELIQTTIGFLRSEHPKIAKEPPPHQGERGEEERVRV
jgi:hypothetical protein